MLKHLIHGDWADLLAGEMHESYFKLIEDEVLYDTLEHQICPDVDLIFEAFNQCQYCDTKVVIIGQDPYITPGISDGLAFSVKPKVRIPPSLLNIFKALKNDLGCNIPNNGSLLPWAKQGVLLLNTSLTTRSDSGVSRATGLWRPFITKVLELLNEKDQPLIFMLWGIKAKHISRPIDRDKHHVLISKHPSPIIPNNDFVTRSNFAEAAMIMYETMPYYIDWQIPNI